MATSSISWDMDFPALFLVPNYGHMESLQLHCGISFLSQSWEFVEISRRAGQQNWFHTGNKLGLVLLGQVESLNSTVLWETLN